MNPDGSNMVNLSRDPGYDYHPTWSPGGRKILFTSGRDGGLHKIYIMDADGGNPQNLTRNRASNSHGYWSPDGRKILFGSTRDGNREVYVMNANGTSL